MKDIEKNYRADNFVPLVRKGKMFVTDMNTNYIWAFHCLMEEERVGKKITKLSEKLNIDPYLMKESLKEITGDKDESDSKFR